MPAMTASPSGAYQDMSVDTDDGRQLLSAEYEQTIGTNPAECAQRQINETHSNNNTSTSDPLSPDPASMVENDEQMPEATDGDGDTAPYDTVTGMRFGAAQTPMKRSADSDVFPQVAAKQPKERDPLCNIDALKEKATPVREDDGDAMHCSPTFLISCSMASPKEMAACNKCANQSPLKITHGSTFIDMSDVKITPILECTVLEPKEAVNDAFSTLTHSELHNAIDGSPVPELAALPDDVATVPLPLPMETEVMSEAAAAVETVTISELMEPVPPEPREPLMQVDVAPAFAAQISSEITTEIVAERTSQVITQTTSQVDMMESTLPDEAVAADMADVVVPVATEVDMPDTPVVAGMTPEFVAEMTPEVEAKKAPEFVAEITPEVLSEMAQNVVTEMTSDVLAEVAPEVVAVVAPEVVAEMALEAVAEMTPKVVTEMASEEVVAEMTPEMAPDVVAEMAPEVVVEMAPDVVAEMTPEDVAEMAPDVVAEITLDVVAEMTPEVVAEMTQEVVVEMTPEVVAKLTPDVVTEMPPKVVADISPQVVEPLVSVMETGIASQVKTPEEMGDSYALDSVEPLLSELEEGMESEVENSLASANSSSILEYGAVQSPVEAVEVSALFENGRNITCELPDASNNHNTTLSGLDDTTDGLFASEITALPDGVATAPQTRSAEPGMASGAAAAEETVASAPTESVPLETTEPLERSEVVEIASEVTTGVVGEGTSQVMMQTSLQMVVEPMIPEEAGAALVDAVEESVSQVDTLESPTIVAETAPEADVVAPTVATQMTPDVVVEMTSKVFAPTGKETEPIVSAVKEGMELRYHTQDDGKSDPSEVAEPLVLEMEKGIASQVTIPDEMGELAASEMAKPMLLEVEAGLASQHNIPEELREIAASEVEEPVVSEIDTGMASQVTIQGEMGESATSEVEEPVVSEEEKAMPSSQGKISEEMGDSKASEVEEPLVSEVREEIASKENKPEIVQMVESAATEMDKPLAPAVALALEHVTLAVPDNTEVASEVATEKPTLAQEEEISDMEASSAEDLSETDRHSSSCNLLKALASDTNKTNKKGRPSTKHVTEQTARKLSKTRVQPRAKQNNKMKNTATSVWSEPRYSTGSSHGLEMSTVSHEARDDVEMETETLDHSATKLESTKMSDTAAPLNNIKNIYKRHGRQEVTAIPSKTQKKTSQQLDVGQAGATSDDETDAVNCLPCLPLERIMSVVRQMAGSKSNDKPEVDSLCPLRTPAEVLEDYSFVISQCDVKKNQNTYFICQVLKTSTKEAYVWYRCGRMGRVSTRYLMGPLTPHIAAIVEFTRMYQNKTGHNWFSSPVDERRQPKVGGYGELDIDYSQSKLVTTDSTMRSYLETAYEYIRRIVSPDKDVHTAEGRPSLLGRLSMAQVLKGYNLLEELEQLVNKSRMKARLRVLSSLYYATIPHDFGKERMAVIESLSKIEGERKFLLTNFVLPVLS